MTSGLNRDRIGSAAIVALLHLLLGYALVAGLGFDRIGIPAERLKLIQIIEPLAPPPPEKAIPAERPSPNNEGAASPANLDSRPTPILAPVPVLPLPVEPPLIAAPVAGDGPSPLSGASDLPGPGTGAGGLGEGQGSGASGDGRGSGAASPGRKLRGQIVHSDYPRSALRARAGGNVVTRLEIGSDGRVANCTITRSSGNTDLDETTCRLIRQRFRYEPARDNRGAPISGVTGWQQRWWLERGGS